MSASFRGLRLVGPLPSVWEKVSTMPEILAQLHCLTVEGFRREMPHFFGNGVPSFQKS